MDKRVKFSTSLKLTVVKAIKAGHDSCESAARKLGAESTSVRRWYSLYQRFGKSGLTIRHQNYSFDFKLEVIEHLLSNGWSARRTAVHFLIPKDDVVGRWLANYKKLGSDGLLERRRGRPQSKQPMTKKKIQKNATGSDPTNEKIAALERELAYLKAENAFLKKLEALVQQEKAANGLDKRQKPSGN